MKKQIISVFLSVLLVGCLQKPVAKTQSFSKAEYEAEMAYQKDLLERYKAKKYTSKDVKNKQNPHKMLKKIAYRINKANGALCQRYVAYDTGIEARLDHDDETLWEVTYVAEDYPAHKAGIRAGDKIVSIDGKTPKDSYDPSPVLLELSGKTETFGRDYKGKIVYKRDGKRYTKRVGMVRSCNYIPRVQMKKKEFNAYADGTQTLTFFGGLIRGYRYDEDYIAYVYAHEMAHAEMDHVDKTKGNTGVILLANVLIKLGAAYYDAENDTNTSDAVDIATDLASIGIMTRYSRDFETEADYIGLYYIARAGYPVIKGAEAQRLMAIVAEGQVNKSNFLSSHPDSITRFLRLNKTVKDIENSDTPITEVIPKDKNGTPLPIYE